MELTSNTDRTRPIATTRSLVAALVPFMAVVVVACLVTGIAMPLR